MKTGPASRTLRQPDRGSSTLSSGDVPEDVTALKNENGPEIKVPGVRGRIFTLLGQYRVDELRVWIFPWHSAPASASSVTARSRSGPKQGDRTVTTTGVTANTCEQAGEIEPASFASGEPEPARDWVELGIRSRAPGGSHKW